MKRLLSQLDNNIKNVVTACLGSLFIAFLYAFAARKDLYGDLSAHIYFTHLLIAKLSFQSHPLFHVVTAIIYKFTSISLFKSGVAAVGIFSFFVTLLIFLWLKSSLNRQSGLQAVFFACGLMVFHSIPLLYFQNKHLYFGYVTSTTFHSPTLIVSKPFAVMHFLFFGSLFSRSVIGWKDYLFLFCLTALSTLAKPIYIFSLVPAVGVFFVVDYLIRKCLRKKICLVYLVSVVTPALSILIFQFKKLYMETNGSVPISIEISWFRNFLLFSEMWMIVPTLVGSLIFPLLFIYLNRYWVKKNVLAQIAIFNMGVSLFLNFFISETGSRALDGNFTWSAQIALLLLNLVCVKRLLENIRDNKSLRLPKAIKIPLFVFLTGCCSGLVWFVAVVFCDVTK